MCGSGNATLLISNKETNDVMKIFKSLGESGLLTKSVSKTIKKKAKEQKTGFLKMSLGTLGANLMGNLLTGKGSIRGSERTIIADEGTIREIKGTIRADKNFKCHLIL